MYPLCMNIHTYIIVSDPEFFCDLFKVLYFVTHFQHQFMNQTVMSRQNYIIGAFFFSFFLFFQFIVWDSELHNFFFSIDNVKILSIIVPNRVHWGCTMGAQIKNQNYSDQEKQEKKNKKNKERPHSTQRECARKKA